ncbi:MAG: hypothetical protein DRN30_03485 [Thermoplasmata archaeon]|nr:MAG: hypothetical protein DRN30_03485 [Thermoplasmata archaeon]
MNFIALNALLHFIILILIAISAMAALISKDLLMGVLALAAMSLLVSLEFYLLHAPDVAIAEAAVGGGLTTALFVLVIARTKRFEDEVEANERK